MGRSVSRAPAPWSGKAVVPSNSSGCLPLPLALAPLALAPFASSSLIWSCFPSPTSERPLHLFPPLSLSASCRFSTSLLLTLLLRLFPILVSLDHSLFFSGFRRVSSPAVARAQGPPPAPGAPERRREARGCGENLGERGRWRMRVRVRAAGARPRVARRIWAAGAGLEGRESTLRGPEGSCRSPSLRARSLSLSPSLYLMTFARSSGGEGGWERYLPSISHNVASAPALSFASTLSERPLLSLPRVGCSAKKGVRPLLVLSSAPSPHCRHSPRAAPPSPGSLFALFFFALGWWWSDQGIAPQGTPGIPLGEWPPRNRRGCGAK